MNTGVLIPRVRSALFEIATCEPEHSTRYVLRTILTLFAVLLAWSIFARLDIVAVAEGRLVPRTYVKIVQPAEAGILREILVTEGQAVKRGDILVRLDPTIASSDRRAAAAQLSLKRLQMRRIDAQLAGSAVRALPGEDPTLVEQVRLEGVARERAFLDQRAEEEAVSERIRGELAAARETLHKLKSTLPTYERAAAAYAKLAGEKLVGELEAEDRQRQATEQSQDLRAQEEHVTSLEAALRSQLNRLQQLASVYRSALQSERSQLLAESNALQEELHKQGYREGLMELRAPQDGVVKDLATTTLGAVVQPGAVLLSVVPMDEPLAAEVFIRNDDVGFVKVGQTVRIKLAPYTFTKYGMLEGRVDTISADAAVMGGAASGRNAPSADDGQRGLGESPFKAIVVLQTQSLSTNGSSLPLSAGMQVQAEIREGERSVLEYLLSPVRRVADEAGGER